MATDHATPAATPSKQELRKDRVGAARRRSSAIRTARKRVTMLIEHVPAAARATQAGARGATRALQRLPASTLRWLAAGSIGLAAGFQLAGVPRVLRAAGVAPALFMGAAIALRPTEPVTAATALSGATTSPSAGLTAHG